MHAPDGICRKPAGARAPVTGGTDGEGARAPRPTAGVAAARPQADPAVGGGACPKGALEPAPWRGATQPGRRGPSSGAGRYAAFPRCLLGDQRTLGREAAGASAGGGHGAANSPPDRAQTAEGRARRRWNAGGEPLRERMLDAGPRERALPLPYGSARDRRDGPGGVPNAAARPIFEQKPFLLRIVGKVIFPTVSKRLAFAQARLLCSTGGTVWAG